MFHLRGLVNIYHWV